MAVAEECPDIQEWTECGTCTKTCETHADACIAVCMQKCQCPDDKPIWHNERCIKLEECPNTGKRDCRVLFIHVYVLPKSMTLSVVDCNTGRLGAR